MNSVERVGTLRGLTAARRLTLAVCVSALAVLLTGLLSLIVQAAKVTIEIQDWSIHDKKYKQSAFKEFNKKHRDIEAKYTSVVSGVYDQTVPLALQSGQAPELFFIPKAITFPDAVESGYIMPLEDVVSDPKELAAWKARFRSGAFREGVNVWNGKTYSWPMQAATDTPYPFFYNKKLFRDAGISLKVGSKGPSPWPASWRPETIVPLVGWDSFALYAQKITELGKGKFYGFTWGVQQPWVMGMNVGQVAAQADPHLYLYGWDYSTGSYLFDSPYYKQVMNLFLKLKKDGSILPGDLSMDDEQAKRAFSLGRAGMQLGYWWNPAGYTSYNPELEFDAFLLVTRDGRDPAPWYSGGGASRSYVISKKADRKAVWEVIKFMTSIDYLGGWVRGGYGIAPIAQANAKENFSDAPAMYYFAHWALQALIPPSSKNAKEVSDIFNMAEWPHPNFEETIQGIWIGKLGLEAFDTLARKQNEALKAAIRHAAEEKGIKIPLEGNLVFPDWDPFKNYQ